MDTCAEHHGDAAQVLRRAARARGITGGYLRVCAIEATPPDAAGGALPASTAQAAAWIVSFPFTRIPIDP